MPPITARPVNHKQCKITRVLAIALILLTPTLSWSEPVKKPDTSKNISSLYYGHYKTISSRLFPSYKSALGKLTKPLFLSTDKITAKFYGPIKKEQYFFIENRESAAFVITWKALKIKKLALYHLDAHKAGHQCCSYSSMETEHCTSLATLVAVFNMKKGLNII